MMPDPLANNQGSAHMKRQGTVGQEMEQQDTDSDRTSTHEALAESEQRFRAVWEAASDAMALSGADGTVFAANPAYFHLFGYSPEEVLGENFARIFPAEQRQRAQEHYLVVFQQESIAPAFEAPILRADGATRIVEARYNFLTHQGKRTAMLSIIRDITERKELEQQKDEFISIASHELKTPLTSLKGYTQLLKRQLEKQGLPETGVWLERMETQLTRLTHLIADLLDVSKIQTGHFDFATAPIDVDVLVHDVAEMMQHLHPTHTLTIQGASNAQINGDRERLEQVFANLISNAVKYSPQATHVAIRITTSQNTVTVGIRDFGIGIAQEHHQNIFQRFYRVSDGHAPTVSGLGLGLYIASEIVKRHGGRLWVESAENEGSTFFLSLPVA